MTPVSPTKDTRQIIIDAAFDCFRHYGLRKTTVVEIGRLAKLSRGTIYQHFRDKAAIVEACAESGSQRFYREMAKAMDEGSTLEDKLSLAAVFVSKVRRYIEPDEQYFDQDEVSLLLTSNAGVLLRDCVDFFAPHLNAARLTGEVRKDLDVQAAGEWYARVLFSLFSTPASTLDMNDPEVVRRFVKEHVVRGFTADPEVTTGRASRRRND
jgi:AcrR family transcriptional regulator